MYAKWKRHFVFSYLSTKQTNKKSSKKEIENKKKDAYFEIGVFFVMSILIFMCMKEEMVAMLDSFM